MVKYQEAEDLICSILKKDLSPKLSYHSFFHVMDVLEAATRIAQNENITGEDFQLLRIAVLFHDSGFLYTYKDHEEAGCELAKKHLPQFNFNEEQLEKICGMIMATKIPQKAQTKLEQTICDADLDYLGRDDFYPIGLTLFEEWKTYLNITEERQWNTIQMNFLKQHFYHTQYSQRVRAALKDKHLQEITKLVNSYV